MRIPLWIEASTLRVLVVGGGNVGTRRALKFHDAGAEVRVLSLWFTDKLVEAAKRSKRISLIKASAEDIELLEENVKWADIIVIATDNPKVNELVWDIALKYRKLVNDATNAKRTHIVVPYEGEVHGIRIAVTSEGRSGIAARWARDRIINYLERDYVVKTLYDVMSSVKLVLKKLLPVAKKRIPIYFEIERDEAFREAVMKGDREAAFKRAAELLASLASKEGLKYTVDQIHSMLLDASKAIQEAISQKP